MIQESDIIQIGKFFKTHGLNGELNASFDIDTDFIDTDHALIINVEGIYVPFYCDSVRSKGSCSLLIKLDGVDTVDDASEFVNKEVYAFRSEYASFFDIEESEIDRSLGDDLIGYQMIDADTKTVIGLIEDIDDSTANILFKVNREGQEILVPLADEFLVFIDDDSRTVGVSLPDGLIDINNASAEVNDSL